MYVYNVVGLGGMCTGDRALYSFTRI